MSSFPLPPRLKGKEMKRSKQFNAKKAKKELDIFWSLAIRKRDKKCRHCKKAPASQAAHIFGRGNLSTRWSPENGFGMCYYCHILWAHREPVEFTIWAQEEIGMARFVELRKKAKTIYDSSNLKADYETIKKTLA
jgi:hypothetical protein